MPDETFDATWLQLREPVDHASRPTALTDLVRDEGRRRGWSRVLDLGTGTGSNVRYLAPRLPWARRWTLVDHDARLLARVECPDSTVDVTAVEGDLAVEGLDAIAGADLVTGSALLDLVGEAWLRDAVVRCATRGCGVLFALSYDGHVVWAPRDDDDAFVHDAVNRHQRGDKGIGAALGPTAGGLARALLEAAGYRTWLVPSPWILTGHAHRDLAHALMDGWAGAAREIHPGQRARIDAWAGRRRAAITSGAYEVEVGHLDVLGLPADPPPDR